MCGEGEEQGAHWMEKVCVVWCLWCDGVIVVWCLGVQCVECWQYLGCEVCSVRDVCKCVCVCVCVCVWL